MIGAGKLVRFDGGSYGGGGGGGTVAFDAASTSKTGAIASSLTWSHTCTGSNRALFVFVAAYSTTISTLPNSVTYNGVSMSKILDIIYGLGYQRLTCWRLVAPATGANNVVVTMAGNTEINGYAQSYTDVHQTTPESGVQTGASTTSTPSLTITSGTGSLVLGCASVFNATITVGAGQTTRNYVSNGSGNDTSMTSDEAGAASVTHSYTLSTSKACGYAAFSIDPT